MAGWVTTTNQQVGTYRYYCRHLQMRMALAFYILEYFEAAGRSSGNDDAIVICAWRQCPAWCRGLQYETG
jgi:hypothetical protein